MYFAAALVLAAYTRAAASQVQLGDGGNCISESSANPISSQWPDEVTGNLNGTTIIIPISYKMARKLIPSEYKILRKAYHSLLPGLRTKDYPMMVSAVHDHDIMLKSANLSLADFSRAAFEFPFVDRLHDGYSSFRWAPTMLITEGSEAINGSQGYGIKVFPATFDPECDAYKGNGQGRTTFMAKALSKEARHLSVDSEPDYDYIPYPLYFIRNITNQPAFATSDGQCDNYIRLFNTSLNEGEHNRPVPVRAVVAGRLEPLTTKLNQSWQDVHGWRLSTAFIEPPLPVSCHSLKGYSGTGPGD